MKDVQDERAARLQRLLKPSGWLSLVGMHWLQVGSTRVGSATDNGTRLDVGPPHLGLVKRERDGRLSFTPEPGVEVTVDGQPATGTVALVTDVDAAPLANGPLRLNFNERPPSGDSKPRSFQMEMQPKLMQGLMHLLDQALLQSQWREPFVPVVAAEPAPDEDSSRPRYLN